jgi:hypothetical protein
MHSTNTAGGFDQQALTQKQDSNYPVDIIEGNFIEIGLPGAHSDIGGSYPFNESVQYANNALLACPPLALMVKHAKESCVPLKAELSDEARKDAGSALIDVNKNDGADCSRSYDDMMESYDAIKPYVEDNSLRAPMGLWREHIALADIYQFKLTDVKENFKPKARFEDHYAEKKQEELQSEINYLDNQLKQVNTKVSLSEQQLKDLFSSESDFNNFKSHYDILYQKYMHRSHHPFNTTFGMGQQDADENFWLWNKTVSDDRPHRDIFYNKLKDFEKINTKLMASNNEDAPEFNILNSEIWNDSTP